MLVIAIHHSDVSPPLSLIFLISQSEPTSPHPLPSTPTMSLELTQGAVRNLYFSEPAPESGVYIPVLQALSVKKIQTPAGNATDRYR